MILALLLMAGAVTEPVPQRQPQLAAAHGMVAMTYGEGTSIYFRPSADGGRTFGAAVKVADVSVLALGRHRGPRLAILRDSLLITAVVGETKSTGPHAHGLPDDGNLVAWRSTDKGATWKRAGVVNDAPAAAREGLHAMTVDGNGAVFAVWLDLRAKGTRLYGAKSTDGGATWAKNVMVYESPEGTICQCCDPSIVADGGGRIWVMWRNVIDGSRDMYAVSSDDGVKFGAPKKLGSGTWKINACPMDGGGIMSSGGKLISAWRRESDVYLTDADGKEKKIGTGKDVAIAAAKRGPVVAWTNEGGIEYIVGGGSIRKLSAEGAFVNLAPLPDGAVLAAWESKGTIVTSRLE